MKRLVFLLLLIFVFSLSATVSAKPHSHHDKPKWSHHTKEKWHKIDYEPVPFRWHMHLKHFSDSSHYLVQIHDHDWDDRFPGLRAYRWRDDAGEGFWHRGHRVHDAVLFFNHSDELVSVGYLHDGAFILIKDDNDSLESRDEFFLAWWRR